MSRMCWRPAFCRAAGGRWESLALAGLALLFLLQNPLLVSRSPSFDASVFAVMGKMWAEGLVLYRDMIDIKGPVIFLINALGYAGWGFKGIWLLEWGLLALGLACLARTLARLGAPRASRWLAMLGILALYSARYYYGNMTEDYSLSLALIAQYGFVGMLLDNRFSWRQAWLPALTFGLICGMRLNNGALWGAFYLVLFVRLCWQGQYAGAIRLFVSSLLGIGAVLLPLALYFHAHGVLANFGYYSFGIFFTPGYGEGFRLAAGFWGQVRTGLWLLLPAYLWLVLSRAPASGRPALLGRPLLVVNLLGLLFTLVGNSVSGHRFLHYDINVLFFFFSILAALLLVLGPHRGGEALASPRQAGVALLGVLGVPLFLMLHYGLRSGLEVRPGSAALAWAAAATLGVLSLAYLLWRPHTHRLHGRRHVVVLAVLLGGSLLWFGGQRSYHQLWRPLPAGQQRIVDEIKAHSGPSDSLLVDHYVPSFYVLADRQAASRWLFAHNVRTDFDLPAARLADMRARRPSHILVEQTRMQSVLFAPERWPASQFAFYDYIRDHYREVLPGLYRRRDIPD